MSGPGYRIISYRAILRAAKIKDDGKDQASINAFHQNAENWATATLQKVDPAVYPDAHVDIYETIERPFKSIRLPKEK